MSYAEHDNGQECESKNLEIFKKYSWICFSADLHLCNVLIVETDRVAHMTTIQVDNVHWTYLFGHECDVLPCHHKIKKYIFAINSFIDFVSQACGLESAAHHHANQTVCLAILVRALEP